MSFFKNGSPCASIGFRKQFGILAAAATLCGVQVTHANVFNMSSGLTSIQFTTIGNPGNASIGSSPAVGAVGYSYQMDKFEVSAAQYTEFLNAVARTDSFGLYHSFMNRTASGDTASCNIVQSGSSGAFSYSVASDYANLPVNLTTWGDAARFCNWLTNGQPNTGVENASTTEDGSYFLNGATSNAALQAVTRKATAIYVIPTEDEWVKAGFYDPNKAGGAGYWTFATQANTTPASTLPFTTPNDANSTNLGDSSHFRTPIGAFVNSPSAYGTFDQDGNVYEMTEGLFNAGARAIRGGGYSGTTGFLVTDRTSINPVFGNDLTGFRIAEVPEPSSMMLLLAGSAAIGARRRKTA
ncbi:MAG TPA: SUMF1/EgtB/PvdO family nonheme iron enzyme [Tepidisphaeraceae bacterium]|nr:SUMF1/EgtB/PvdO family nonheme iron enzyme [Tepidisphaeraceae bacterium]